jgi:hypothetical protein
VPHRSEAGHGPRSPGLDYQHARFRGAQICQWPGALAHRGTQKLLSHPQNWLLPELPGMQTLPAPHGAPRLHTVQLVGSITEMKSTHAVVSVASKMDAQMQGRSATFAVCAQKNVSASLQTSVVGQPPAWHTLSGEAHTLSAAPSQQASPQMMSLGFGQLQMVLTQTCASGQSVVSQQLPEGMHVPRQFRKPLGQWQVPLTHVPPDWQSADVQHAVTAIHAPRHFFVRPLHFSDLWCLCLCLARADSRRSGAGRAASRPLTNPSRSVRRAVPEAKARVARSKRGASMSRLPSARGRRWRPGARMMPGRHRRLCYSCHAAYTREVSGAIPGRPLAPICHTIGR